MSPSPTAVIQEALAALNALDFDAYAAAFHPAAERWIPGAADPLPGEVVLGLLREVAEALGDFHLEPVLVLGDGNYVIVRGRTSGIHSTPLFGIEPTGREIRAETCEIYELRDGLVVRSWAYGDPAELISQLERE